MSTTRATKRALRESVTPRHHLDRRAASILKQPSAAGILPSDADDVLMSTKQLAEYLGVSTQFLEIARGKNRGPRFVRVADRVIRYRMDDVRRWLAQRAFSCTSEYERSAGGGAA